jgi:hypothetical protein
MKSKKPGGNGDAKLEVHVEDKGGWIRVFPARLHDLPDELPGVLSMVLTEWFRARPHYRMRTVCPITKEGMTVELHAWFDLHVMPTPPGESGQH